MLSQLSYAPDCRADILSGGDCMILLQTIVFVNTIFTLIPGKNIIIISSKCNT